MKDIYQIAVVPGDGIGPEVAAAAVRCLDALFGPAGPLVLREHPAGAELYRRSGESFPAATYAACRDADAILHGAAGLPGIVHPDGTEAGLDFTLRLRFELDLFANIRPIRLYPGVRSPLAEVAPGGIDYVIVRENSEGLYAARGAGAQLRGELAVDTLVQTRKGVERIVRQAFELARSSRGAPADGVRRVTCVDKANVLRSYAFFRAVFDEVAAEYPEIEAEHGLIDAMAMYLVTRPGHYNVIVTENMFGDILSDLAAATIGGLGLAPSAEIGVTQGLFQASHGSAPDIAGKGIANPYGTLLSAAAMLDWLATRHADARLGAGARRLRQAVEAAIAEGVLGRDLGGRYGSAEITEAVCARLG
ncbi:isocitrate/isopropylmalate dehydrogenase family protein [Sinirhodobacter ferrireducens]|uniref:3-isopropylmalate dehydrogenase n=1 Tax=Paenirhodobacter ferrireducens TaxID=1215032 RepID=A0A443LM19_9RHOB|nr:isocitrate/isopropylmalate dehydrogenase family protein [Sinirhodobacter ferrireducens]RWR50169.1 isocitrate/isopropylmalate dehydrogenase family protein [Sinirhodobacter ferrireducens]